MSVGWVKMFSVEFFRLKKSGGRGNNTFLKTKPCYRIKRSFQEHFFVRNNGAWRYLRACGINGAYLCIVEFWRIILPLFSFYCWNQFIVEPLNLERSLPFSSVNLLIPERGVTTHFLCLSPSDSAAYHVWPPCRGRLQSAAAVNLQEHCAPLFQLWSIYD